MFGKDATAEFDPFVHQLKQHVLGFEADRRYVLQIDDEFAVSKLRTTGEVSIASLLKRHGSESDVTMSRDRGQPWGQQRIFKLRISRCNKYLH